MADRITLILQLGAMQADATQRGDDRAVATLQAAAELLVQGQAAADAVEAARAEEERRREDARLRKRKSRGQKSPDVTSGHVTSRDLSSGFSPTPPFPNLSTTQHNTPREADSLYAESVENLTNLLVSRLGSCWNDVDAFLRRRPFATWDAWMKTILSVLTDGQATPEDVEKACRDEAALNNPIATPKGLRSFVASATQERTQPAQKPRMAGGVANRTYAVGRRALEGLP